MPNNPEREGSPRLITLKQIEQEHGVSRSALHTYRRTASFPQPVPAEGSTRTHYRADEVAAWFEANPPQQGKRTDLAEKQPQGEPVTTSTDLHIPGQEHPGNELRRAAQRLRDLACDITGELAGLAAPVAEWLDQEAHHLDGVYVGQELPARDQAAIRVARTILGE